MMTKMVLTLLQCSSATVASGALVLAYTHEEDDGEPQLLENVTHQLNQATENSSNDALFACCVDRQT